MGTLKKDFIWNLLGSFASAMSMPLMVIIATRISGEVVAGKFSVAFITAQLLMILGNYGVRVFQASDIGEEFSFNEYLINRGITCIIMLLSSIGFALIRRYNFEMAIMVVVLTAFKMFDALADVFEGRFQQKGYLYIAGQSLFFRTVLSVILFYIILSISNNIIFTSFIILTAYFILFLLFTIRPWKKFNFAHERNKKGNVQKIFIKCFPLFITLFMLAYINNSLKYAIEKTLSYSYQTYFNAIYFPAQTIYLFTSFVFKPLLLRMSEYWVKPGQRSKILTLFNRTLIGVIGFTTLAEVIAYFWGVPILSLIFSLDLFKYRGMLLIMILGGCMVAITNFLFNVLTVMRKQRFIFITYGLTFLLSLFIPKVLVNIYGFGGAVISYLIMMIFQAVLMTLTFIITYNQSKNQKNQILYKGN